MSHSFWTNWIIFCRSEEKAICLQLTLSTKHTVAFNFPVFIHEGFFAILAWLSVTTLTSRLSWIINVSCWTMCNKQFESLRLMFSSESSWMRLVSSSCTAEFRSRSSFNESFSKGSIRKRTQIWGFLLFNDNLIYSYPECSIDCEVFDHRYCLNHLFRLTSWPSRHLNCVHGLKSLRYKYIWIVFKGFKNQQFSWLFCEFKKKPIYSIVSTKPRL